MTLQCVMILGNKNEPLWSLDLSESKDTQSDDVFGFSDKDWKDDVANDNLSFDMEFKMHAALDRLEEKLGSRTNTLPRWQRSSNWTGSLGCIEHGEVYCYVSASNVKILGMVERPDIIMSTKKNRETEIKNLLADVYGCYILHSMNPFATIRGRIQRPCTQFDDGVRSAIQNYNEAVVSHQNKTQGTVVA